MGVKDRKSVKQTCLLAINKNVDSW